MERRRVDCVGGIVTAPDGHILLVRRANAPAAGLWSVPGGRVEPGEDDATATAREIHEETGLRVRVSDLVGTVERDAPDGSVFVIRDYRCTPEDGADPAEVVAGDDAVDVGWFTPDQVRELDCAPGLVEALDAWGVLGDTPSQCTPDMSLRIGPENAASRRPSATATPPTTPK